MSKNQGRGRLTQAQVEELRVKINTQIEELSPTLNGEIKAQRNEEQVVVSDDCSQHFSALEQRAAMVTHRSRRLRDLQEAKRRLSNGTYGWCLGCENPISFKRLVAVPTAVHCIDCMKASEGGKLVPGLASI